MLLSDWLCSRSSSETYIVSARETSTCVYLIQIYTPIVCQSTQVCSNIRNPRYSGQICPMAVGTPKLALTNESQPLMVGIDDTAVRVRMPFVFYMYGLQYRWVYIGSNGILSFGTRGFEWAYVTMPVQGSDTDTLPLVAPFWSDLNVVDDSRITYSNEIINNTRAFVVRYSNVEYYGNVLAGVVDSVSFDVVMFEGLTGKIEVRHQQERHVRPDNYHLSIGH